MADVINLRLAKKQRQRSQKTHQAEENRRIHGMSKSQKSQMRLEKQRANVILDQHKLSDEEPL